MAQRAAPHQLGQPSPVPSLPYLVWSKRVAGGGGRLLNPQAEAQLTPAARGQVLRTRTSVAARETSCPTPELPALPGSPKQQGTPPLLRCQDPILTKVVTRVNLGQT